MMKGKTDYDLHLENQKRLLKLAKKKGILVKKMEVGDNFLIDRPSNDLYKRNLGAVEVYDLFRKKIKSVYVVYEDFDGSIKYYDYPQQKPQKPQMRNIVSVLLVQLITWCFIFIYHLTIGLSTITEFALVFIVTGLLINGIYFVGSIMILK